MMKIYTKSGDDGTTGLLRGGRVKKNHARIEAYGTVDELCSVIGIARATQPKADIDAVLAQLQQDLFSMGADLATPELDTASLSTERVTWVERQIDRVDSDLPALANFVLPAGTSTAAALHHARTVCRRAERRVVSLAEEAQVPETTVIYLNRTSDLLFVLARAANFSSGEPDVVWNAP